LHPIVTGGRGVQCLFTAPFAQGVGVGCGQPRKTFSRRIPPLKCQTPFLMTGRAPKNRRVRWPVSGFIFMEHCQESLKGLQTIEGAACGRPIRTSKTKMQYHWTSFSADKTEMRLVTPLPQRVLQTSTRLKQGKSTTERRKQIQEHAHVLVHHARQLCHMRGIPSLLYF
jgi:hypothetical protein